MEKKKREEKASAFISAADSVSPCKDIKGGGTEQGNQKVSAAVIKMSHECTITRKPVNHPARPRNHLLNSVKSP